MPSDTVIPWPNWDHKTYTVEDMAAGMIRFDNGALLTIEASFVAHIEKDTWTFQVMGEKGGADGAEGGGGANVKLAAGAAGSAASAGARSLNSAAARSSSDAAGRSSSAEKVRSPAAMLSRP